MKPLTLRRLRRCFRFGIILVLAMLFVLQQQGRAEALTVNVVTSDGTQIGSGFRWLLEEDNTNQTPPGVSTASSLSLDIHKSYAPPVAAGSSASGSTSLTVPDPTQPYFISAMPDSGYTIGGASVPAGADAVNVIVTKYDIYNQAFPNTAGIPTAQVSVLVFEDNASINNAPDLPNEQGLEGFDIIIMDNAGRVMQDAFGNMLGTTYTEVCDGAVPPNCTVEVQTPGNGIIRSDINGEAYIKYLPPGKYGVQVIPPTLDPNTGEAVNWVQTATIEGTPTIDAWAKANEPPVFTEGFGVGGKHVAFGFINPATLPWAVNPPMVDISTPYTGSLSGRNVFNHFSRPPVTQGYFPGDTVGECWVGLNDPVSGQGLLAAPCDEASLFSFDGLPPGTYELVTWDKPLLSLFGFNTVTVTGNNPTGDSVDLGNVLSFRWFGTFEGFVFDDVNQNGYRDANEPGIPETTVNIRFRDGTLYQTQPTDVDGWYELSEVFPFFKWLITEVDYGRRKPTGMTAIIDYGGPVDPNYPPFPETADWDPRAVGVLHPQPQPQNNPVTLNNLSRNETGSTVLLEAMLLFLNQTNIIDWGKTDYLPGENGGISGVITYDVTRDVNDPAFAAAQDWDPGIPRVQVNLYQDFRINANGLPAPDGIIDDLDHDGVVTLADVDNYPLGNFPGDEDIDHNANGIFDPGDAVQIVHSDSFDDSAPTGCIQTLPVINGEVAKECYDGFGTWNQVRPGVFDGGYLFDSYVPGGLVSGAAAVSPLAPGSYIVEAANPRPGVYELVKEEDKNVDFGDTYVPSPQLLPAVCVGDLRTVPPFLSLFPDQFIPTVFAGQERPLCDRKEVILGDADNAAANFFYFTAVPKAARAVGFVNNDLSAEFDPTSPVFGEKAAPAWIPVAFRDWQGNEISRVYTDQFGSYNALLPSSFTANVPTPTGISPNMLTLVLNDPNKPVPNSPGQTTIDPNYDERYSVSPWTLHYESGRTTYLDTPIVPVAAFVTNPAGTLDSNPPLGTPVIDTVIGTDPNQALVCTDTLVGTTATVTINAVVSGRDSGFGTTEPTVLINGSSDGITIDSWSETQIVITIDITVITSGGQLTVIRTDNGLASERSITLQVADCATGVTYVAGGSNWPDHPIQDAIDAANPGDLIIVGPGVYKENVIMWKPVRLQGAGGDQTRIDANPDPAERITAWHAFFVDPAHPIAGGPFNANENPGIFVIGTTDPIAEPTRDFNSYPSLIDGFTISGSLSGAGIAVMSDVHDLRISNNNVRNNQGEWGGGITVGIPDTGSPGNDTNLVINNNRVASNGGLFGAGGIAIYAGSDDYLVENNRIVANFSRASGGGIAHVGVSDGGIIRNNRILFNEVFYGQVAAGGGYGGGLFLSGDILPAVNPTLSTGAGSVTVEGNLIQGNMAGAGDGGGIAVYGFNGNDVQTAPGIPASWYTLTVQNNMIVNNVAALGGGGISLQDLASGRFLHNTITSNDSTATALLAFPAGNLTVSSPQAGGIVSHMHSMALAAAGAGFTQTYSDPQLTDNIVWNNRSFFNDATINGGQGGLLPASQHVASDAAYAAALPGYNADATPYPDVWDLQVVGALAGEALHPDSSLLSELTPTTGEDYSGANLQGDPGFVRGYNNTLATASVIDEGGNFISVRFTPLTETSGDYHLLTACSLAVDNGIDAGIVTDIDGDSRPQGSGFDIGADEYVAPPIDPLATFAVLQPNGGEFIPAGTTYTIRWTTPYDSTQARYDLAYSTGPGSPFRIIATGIDGNCFAWSVPGDIHSSNVRIGVIARDAVTPAVLARDFSDAPFTIDVIALLHPNGGEVTTSGTVYTIQWTSTYAPEPVTRVGLWYRTNPGANWTPIAATADTGRYDWTVPTVPTTVTTASVALVLYNASGQAMLSDFSDAPFTILASLPPAQAAPAAAVVQPLSALPVGQAVVPVAEPLATVTATAVSVELLIPNGGEVLLPGQPLPLLWISPAEVPAASVVVSYSDDGGTSWTDLIKLDNDPGYYEWAIGADIAPTEQGLIRVARFDANGTLLDSDQSNDVFSIRPAN